MPYPTEASLPDYVKKYSHKLRKAWQATFNSTYKKVLKETGSKKQAEQRAFRAANSVVKKHSEKFGVSRYGHGSMFLVSVDKFVGRLEG